MKSFFNFAKILTLIAASCMLGGCASVISGLNQNVKIAAVEAETNAPLKGVSCQVIDGNGAARFVSRNPGYVQISRSQNELCIKCSKPGYRQLNSSINSSLNFITLLNVMFWPGFIVDAATGAYKNYPQTCIIEMEKIA